MATISSPAMTWEAFEKLPDSDGYHREILKGELQVLPAPKSGHSQIASNLYELLRELKHMGLGRAYLEAGYKLTQHPPTWVQPDASFLLEARAIATTGEEYFAGAPDLAIEIISPSESASDVEQKIELMLASGCQTIWVVYPKTQTAHVFSQGGRAQICNITDQLPGPAIAPNWTVPVARIFEN